ncbi:MAG: N-6 DNA methylase [Alphaproteobacteria bacterium]|nr:N-6 DNA methylase [Alphaproteobacteria bacterium]
MRAEAPHSEKLINLIQETSRRHNTWQVFQDFVAMSAISIRNAVDFRDREKYEEQYLDIIKRYDKTELEAFPKMLGELILALEDDMADILGQIFSRLELGNKWKGQFFTPDCVCRLMAAMSYGNGLQATIAEKGYISVGEPAVGGGAMIIALAHEMKRQGLNYQRQLHVTATDIDLRAVHMSYLQLSLLHIPAVIIHGDTIRQTEHSRWHTPAHIFEEWDRKIFG